AACLRFGAGENEHGRWLRDSRSAPISCTASSWVRILPAAQQKWDRKMGKLDGMVAAVTGGASGIGEATVRRFIAEGAEVAFADRDATRGRRVAAEIVAGGGKALFVEADVGHESACLAFIQQTLEQLGRLN